MDTLTSEQFSRVKHTDPSKVLTSQVLTSIQSQGNITSNFERFSKKRSEVKFSRKMHTSLSSDFDFEPEFSSSSLSVQQIGNLNFSISSFKSKLSDILNGKVFSVEAFRRKTELLFTGTLASVGSNYLLELLLMNDPVSYIVRKPNSFPIVSKVVSSICGDHVMFGIKHYTSRINISSTKSKDLAFAPKNSSIIFHLFDDQITLCTKGEVIPGCHSECMCQFIPLICYKVSFAPYVNKVEHNRNMHLSNTLCLKQDFFSDLNSWYENIILPLGLEDVFGQVSSHFSIASVVKDELSLVYGDDDCYEYVTPITFDRDGSKAEIKVPVKVHKFDDGEVFLYSQEVRELAKRILDAMLNTSQMYSLFSSAVSSIVPGSDILEDIRELLGKVNGATDAAASFMDYVKENWHKAILLLSAGFGTYIFLRAYFSNDYEPLQRVSAMLLPVLVFVPKEVASLFDFLFRSERVYAQSGSDVPWEQIITLILGATQYVAGVRNPKFGMKDIISILGSLPKATDGLSKVLNSLIDVCTAVFGYVKEQLYGTFHVPSESSHFPKVKDFMAECVNLINLHNEGKLDVNLFNFDKITSLQRDGLSLLVHGKYGSETRHVSTQVKTFLNMLDKIRRPFEQSTIRADFSRVEPLTLLFRGQSGVGKSTLSKPFLAALLARLLPREELPGLKSNLDQYIYTRTPETKYWDGYKGQYVTVMDDFAQCYDIAGDPDNEYMSLIRCTNRFPYVLHMASLEDKGSNVFKSKVIFCTTNETNFQTVASIKSREALIRRFDYIVDVVVNDATDENGNYIYGYKREGCPDLKIKNTATFSKDAWKINIIEGVNEHSGGRVVQTVDFDTFVGICAGTFLSKVDSFEDINKGCDVILDNSIRERLSEESDEIVEGFSADLGPIEIEETPVRTTSVLHRLYTKFSSYFTVQQFKDLYSHFVLVETQKLSSTWEYLYDEYFSAFLTSVVSMYQKKQSSFKDMASYVTSIVKRDFEFMKIKSSKIFASFTNTVTGVLKNVEDFSKKHPILFLFSGWLGMNVIFRIIIALTCSNEAHSNPKNTRKKGGSLKKQRHVREFETAGYTESADLGSVRIGEKLLHKNSLILSLPNCEDEVDKSGIVIGISGNICMLPRHYFTILQSKLNEDELYKYEVIDLYRVGGTLFRTLTVEQFMAKKRVDIPRRDMCLLDLDAGAALFPNIEKHFVPKHVLDKIIDAKSTLYGVDSCWDGVVVKQEVRATKCAQPIRYYDSTDEEHETDSAFYYYANSKSGDCGSLLIHDNSSMVEGVILGIHVAGSSAWMPSMAAKGYASCITREHISSALAKFDKIHTQGPVFDAKHMEECDNTLLFGEFPVVAKAKPGLALNVPTKSELVQMDDFYGKMGEATIKPAHLHPFKTKDGERIDPMRRAVLKYSGSQAFMDTKLVKLCVKDTFNDMILESKHDVPREILTFEQAVEGIHGEEFINGLPRGTSAGWPKVRTKDSPLRGKKAWFGSEGDYDFSTEKCKELKLEVEKIISDAKKGIRPSVVFMDCLKDETRPIEKVEAGKTRLISAAPLAYLIACRMVFMRFTQWVMKNRVANGIAVGVNAYSKEWSSIVDKLHEVSNKMFDGDYGGYDTNQNKQVGDEICEGINEWYDDGEEWANVRRVFFMDIYSSTHICGDKVYQWVKSLPSGHPLTTIVNSIYNACLIRMGFVTAMDRNYAALKLFKEAIRYIVYGDDNVISVHKDFRDKFNCIKFAEFISTIGMEYTDAQKTGTLSDTFKSIKDISFLKRSFVWDTHFKRFIAPLDWNVVRQMLYFLRKNIDMKGVVVSASQSFLREASLHDKEKFELCIRTYRDTWIEEYDFLPKVTDHLLAREITLGEELRY